MVASIHNMNNLCTVGSHIFVTVACTALFLFVFLLSLCFVGQGQ